MYAGAEQPTIVLNQSTTLLMQTLEQYVRLMHGTMVTGEVIDYGVL